MGVKCVPSVFIVSDDTTTDAYMRFWSSLSSVTRGSWKPKAIITDFEQALISSLQKHFSTPGTFVWGEF
jgi:hypothetical protein